ISVVVPATIDAAVVLIADPDESFGISHRQVMEQDGIDQRKDGRVGADAERESEQHSGRKPRRLAQLSKCISKILQQNSHYLSSTHVALEIRKHVMGHAFPVLGFWNQQLTCSAVRPGVHNRKLVFKVGRFCDAFWGNYWTSGRAAGISIET